MLTALSLFKPSLAQEENWSVRKEILLIMTFLVLVGMVQFLIRDLIYDNSNNWSWKYLIEEIRNTLLIGSLFAILFTSLNFNRLNARNVKKAKELNAAPHPPKNISNKIIQIETSVKSDAFELNVDRLLFAKAVGNYVEIYLREDPPGKMLKRITLKDLLTVLSPFPNIIKTHRSYLVNLDFVDQVTGNAQGYKLKLSNCAEKIPVARNLIHSFNAKITCK
jgi:DNA-binding LytR/AlgR family response regulator